MPSNNYIVACMLMSAQHVHVCIIQYYVYVTCSVCMKVSFLSSMSFMIFDGIR